MQESELMNIKESSRIIGCSEDALRARIKRGIGPKAYKQSERSIVIKRKDLREWLDNLKPVEPRT